MNGSIRPRIGLLALTLELYETMVPGLRASREAWVRQSVLPALRARAEVSFSEVCFQREAVDAAIGRFEAEALDAIVIVLLTYAPSQNALPALQRTSLPIIIWNTQERLAVDGSFRVEDMIDNHGVHGTQDLASVLIRSGVRFHYVTSAVNDPRGMTDLNDRLVAAAAVRRLRRARVGMLGHSFPGMGDFAVDTTHLISTIGCAPVHLSIEDYIERSADASREATAQWVDEYRRAYEVAADVTTADLEATARSEVAVRGMIHDARLDAWTYQFMAFGEDERTSTVPFVAASRLMAEGVGFAGEGDLVAAAATAFFHWLNPPASFSEMFTIDFAGQSVFLSHMGEANVGMARRDRKPPLVARPSPITRTRDRQLALVTCFEPGPATLACLAQGPGGRWRVIAAPMIIEDFGPLPGFFVPHAKCRPEGDVSDFLTRYALAGGPHHNAVLSGKACPRLRWAAEWLEADYLQL